MSPAPAPGPASEWAGGLQLQRESRLPGCLPSGQATALFCFGTCFHSRREVAGLEILVDGLPQRVTAFGMPRLDLYHSLHPHLAEGADADPDSAEDPDVRCYRSGFWATVQVPARAPGRAILLQVRARLEDGTEASGELGGIEVADGETVAVAPGIDGSPEIAICMSTYNPDMRLFRVQVDSLRAQTDTDWVCVVSDDCSRPECFREIEAELSGDARFRVSRSERRLGFYRSFERALRMAPSEASLIALCDQDDRWYPEKLATLRRELGSARLIYSDQRLVDTRGGELARTYWTTRRNNHENLVSLLIANTITGAASLMRREVVELALPFPEVPGEQYHDHWLGLVAMTLGEVAYVDRPLYDYVQHGGALLGHAAANAGLVGGRTPWRDRLRPAHWRQLLAHSRSAYFRAYVRLEVLAQVLLARAGRDASRRKRRALRRFIRAARSPFALAWLALRPQRRLFGRNETLGVERLLVQGVLWRYLLPLRLRGVTRPTGSAQDASMPPSPGASGAPVHGDPETAHIERMITPLCLSVSDREPERINLLIPTIDLKHLFGGYIAKFNLARKLAESGRRVRIVAVDPTPTLPANWREQVESYSGLAGTFSKVEVAFARDADVNLPVSPGDRFIATTWWTAHLARDAVAETNRERFLYLIQEYEPFTFVMGSWAAVAMQTYTFPHLALFSTELLRSYFAKHGHGVYAEGVEAGERNSTSFQNAITPVTPPSAAELASRDTRRLLFYARSEPHAKRNLFELGLIAIAEAIEEGTFGPEWEFVGVGGVGGRTQVALPGGASLDLLTRRKQTDYGAMLAEHDVGLSLMFTPHPSLVPLEMASAGLLTVTNSFETKTAAAMEAISPNLITTEPSIEAVAEGLGRAVSRVGNHAARLEGAAVDWSQDWEDSFDDPVLSRIDELLERC